MYDKIRKIVKSRSQFVYASKAEIDAEVNLRLATTNYKDDLTKISGIGKKIQQRLNNIGIVSYSQIVDWSDDEINAIDEQLSLNGRITRDDWLGQAWALDNEA